MFPDEEMFGIDLVVPDVTYLKENRDKVRAFLITHAHEDHVGGLPYVLPEFPGVPDLRQHARPRPAGQQDQGAQAPQQPAAGARARRRARRSARSRRSRSGSATRSRTRWGSRCGRRSASVVHTGDFKFDHTPVDGKLSDFHILARLGEEGVICLLSDSTRAENPGYTPSERTVGDAFREIMEPLDGRVIVATFASNIARIQQVLDAAADDGPQGRGHRPVDGAELPDRDRPRLPQVRRRRTIVPKDKIKDIAGRQARSSRRPAPRASRWRALRGWRTATTASSRSSPATPSSCRPARSRATRNTSPAPSTTCSRRVRTCTTTRSSAPTSQATRARRSSS